MIRRLLLNVAKSVLLAESHLSYQQILNDILLNIQKDKFEKIADERDGNMQETDEISDKNESKGINASLEEIRAEKAKEMAEGLMNAGKEPGDIIKPKVKEMER